LPDPPLPPALDYVGKPPPLTRGDLGRTLLPNLIFLAAGAGLFRGIAYWLRIRYGPYAITQWATNAKQVEFWYLDVPLGGWFVAWALLLAVSLQRSRTRAGRDLTLIAALATLFVGFLDLAVIMDIPFP
jgi:hypothetical protein